MMGRSDEELFASALRDGRVVYTQDDDFLALAASGAPHAGVAFLRQGEPVGRAVRGLLVLYEGVSAEEMAGRVGFL